MASLMWNHAPDMWAAMEQQGVQKGSMTPEKAADLFAYFVSARYFEKPGDAARGKQAFRRPPLRRLPRHHQFAGRGSAAGGQVGIAGGPRDPGAADVESRAKMRAEFASKKLAWGQITGQELTDMLVYLQNLPETRNLAKNFSFTPSDAGREAVRIQGLRGVPCGQTRARRCC